MTSGPCQETSYTANHVEPRVKLYSPREESFPIPLTYIDVSRTTHTNLDVKQEKRIDDSWNIDGSRDFSGPWRGFTQVTLLEGKPPDGYMWSVERLARKQMTSRPEHLWPDLWIKFGRKAQLKERHKWSDEKPKLDDARRLRGICVLEPEDKEFKETIKKARKKLETLVVPAMPCKTSKKCKHGETRGKSNEIKSKLACILEASESTRLRMGESPPNQYVIALFWVDAQRGMAEETPLSHALSWTFVLEHVTLCVTYRLENDGCLLFESLPLLPLRSLTGSRQLSYACAYLSSCGTAHLPLTRILTYLFLVAWSRRVRCPLDQVSNTWVLTSLP